MIEINLENKAKFLANYIGCTFDFLGVKTRLDHILLDSEKPFGWIDVDGSRVYSNSGAAILKPISSITDEDAIVIAKLFGLANGKILVNNSELVLLEDDSYELSISGINGYIRMSKIKSYTINTRCQDMTIYAQKATHYLIWAYLLNKW